MPPKEKSASKAQDITEGLKESVKVHQDIQKSAGSDPLNPTNTLASLLDTTQLMNSLSLQNIAQRQLKRMVRDLEEDEGPVSFKSHEPSPQAHPVVSVLEQLPEKDRSEWLEKNKDIVPHLLATGPGGTTPLMSALMKEESKPGGAGQFAEFAEIINTMTKTGLLNQTAQSAGMQDMLKMILFAKELFAPQAPPQDNSVAIVNAVAQIAKGVQDSNAMILARLESMSGGQQSAMYEKLLEIQRASFESQKAIQDQLVREQLARVEDYTGKLEQQLATVREELKQKSQGPSLEPLLNEIRQLRAANTASTTDKDVQMKQMELGLEQLKLEQEHQRQLKELELKANEISAAKQVKAHRDAKLESIVGTLMNYGRAMTIMNSMNPEKTSSNVSSLMQVKI